MFDGRVVITAVQVPSSELVVITHQSTDGVPHDQHQLGLVVRLPELLSHAGGVEISRRFLHTNLPG